jgi:hypothetical protein
MGHGHSYDRKKARDLSGVGWIIFCTRTGLRLMGTFWEKSTGANLYRAEMLGLCAYLLAQAVAEFYKVDKWAAILCCDNKCALELSSHHRCRIRPSAKCADTPKPPCYQTILYWELQIHSRIRPHGSISRMGPTNIDSTTQLCNVTLLQNQQSQQHCSMATTAGSPSSSLKKVWH